MCLLVRHTEMDQRIEAVGHLERVLKCLRQCCEYLFLMSKKHLSAFYRNLSQPRATNILLFMLLQPS